MPLGTGYINTTIIGNGIGSILRAIGALCNVGTINPWSRFKPVRGSWPAGTAGSYGLDLANNWVYLRPRGSSETPVEDYRGGDFRGYEHIVSEATKCMPPIHTIPAEFEEDDLYPSSNPSSNSFKIRGYRTAGDNENGVLPSLFTPSLEGYFYGIRFTQGTNHWFKTYGLVSALTTAGLNADISPTMTDSGGPWEYENCPNVEGAVTFELIISSVQYSDWTLNPSPTYHVLPSGTYDAIVCKSSGSFTIYPWLEISPEQYTWDGLTEETEEFTVSLKTGETWVFHTAIPTWLNVEVGHYIGEPAEWTVYSSPYPDQAIIRIYPDAPISSSRNVDLFLARSDYPTVGINDIALVQEEEKLLPSISLVPSGFSVIQISSTVTYGSTAVTFSFRPDTTGTAQFIIKKDGSIIGALTFNDSIEDGVTYSGGFTLPTAAGYNEVYEINVNYPAP